MKKLISLFAVIAMLTAAVAPVCAGDLPYSQDAVDAAIAAIDAIGEVDDSLECEERIINAENAYAVLSNDERAAVTNYDVLVAARLKFDSMTSIDGMVPYAIWLIDQIGTVEYTNECLARIKAAEDVLKVLSAEQLAAVTNYDVYVNAYGTYCAMEPLDDLPLHAMWQISQIGEVEYTDECLARIEAAEELLDAMSADQLAQVTNYDVFLAAKARYEELRPVVAGDADGDGALNALDVRVLMRFLVGEDVEIDRKAADFNRDGKTNNRDVLLMMLAIVNG